ncbi:hypothetical protein EZL74_07025 [Flavobacterium silvisoli]|uniref:GIY-YIG domain-containing protein n=1 Tax=Flavobacterium silvisoli TaxID=2529433 RepID=A0A4V2L577_9FLAO|nr:hypothetical protein [Flavobacterium silvisoli]TBX69623.1 hypothetical protein EZL74_07025 [Flavobacterium silvisoli]
MIDEKDIENYFIEVRDYLLNKENKVKFNLIRNQCNEVEAGVYCFFVDNKLKYIGESGCLKKRINDLLNTKNHTFRRSLGELYFSSNELYTKASSTSSYHSDIEKLLEEKMKKHLSFSHMAMKIGRKEFEEWFQKHFKEIEFLNKRTKRK